MTEYKKDTETQVHKLTNNQGELLVHIHPRLPHCPDIHMYTHAHAQNSAATYGTDHNRGQYTMVVITTTMVTTIKMQDAITEVVRMVEVIGLQHQEMVQAIEM